MAGHGYSLPQKIPQNALASGTPSAHVCQQEAGHPIPFRPEEMPKLTAIHESVKGRPVWEVNVPLSVCGKRVRISRPTEREAIAEGTSVATSSRHLSAREFHTPLHGKAKRGALRDGVSVIFIRGDYSGIMLNHCCASSGATSSR